MRLFISLPLDEAMRRHLAAILNAIVVDEREHDVRWVSPANLHVTLKFLGQVSDAELPNVIEALSRVQGVGPVQIAAGQPDPVRHRGQVHLITAEIKDIGGNLVLLRDGIEGELEPLGFGREKRAFWPHVTIGRSRRGVRISLKRFAARGAVGVIDRFELMSSTLGPEGPRYVSVASFSLA